MFVLNDLLNISLQQNIQKTETYAIVVVYLNKFRMSTVSPFYGNSKEHNVLPLKQK